jgi:hypothetical protein
MNGGLRNAQSGVACARRYIHAPEAGEETESRVEGSGTLDRRLHRPEGLTLTHNFSTPS